MTSISRFLDEQRAFSSIVNHMEAFQRGLRDDREHRVAPQMRPIDPKLVEFLSRPTLQHFAPPPSPDWTQYMTPMSAEMIVRVGHLAMSIFEIKCYASKLMTHLLSWRNPRTNEESARSIGFVSRAITTQLALPLVSVVAAVETVAYAAIVGLKTLFAPLVKLPPLDVCGLLRSSSTTLLWSITSFAHTNYRSRVLEVEESAFRNKLSSLFKANVLAKA